MRTGFPGEHPAVFSPCPTGLDYTSFFRQNKGTPRRCGGFLQSCNTEPFCMGRTVDFSGGIVYDKNGSVGTRGRKVNHVRGCCAAGTAKAGKRPGACLKETGSETPRERHCGRKNAPKRQGRRDESPPLGAPPREGRMQTRSHRLHGARQENCTAEDIQRGGRFLRWAQTGSMRRRCLLFQGMDRRFLHRVCICFSSAADTLR